MTERSEMERFIAWCSGDGLDGSKDYRALQAVARFRAYEAQLSEKAKVVLIMRAEGRNRQKL